MTRDIPIFIWGKDIPDLALTIARCRGTRWRACAPRVRDSCVVIASPVVLDLNENDECHGSLEVGMVTGCDVSLTIDAVSFDIPSLIES